ncbi:thiolase family protein [Nitriliruptoraceae bacterium ZYF776]|nr:thiolase family protein [Profundirhabdus halotolerans]
MSTGVAIVGLGIHPFGRTPGVSGRQQGVIAARRALADAGVRFEQIDLATGGSMDGGDADSLVSDLGLTGLPFQNLWNGCGTGGSALLAASHAIAAGAGQLGLVVGFDAHPRGAFNTDPASLGIGDWYAESGMMLTTQFFALKVQRYLHEHDLDPSILATIAAKAFENGARNPNAWRRQPLSEREILDAPMINDPLTKFMYCAPGEGAVALVVCPSDQAHRYHPRPIHLRSAVLRTRRFGSFEVFSPWLSVERGPSPSADAARLAFEQAGLGPDEIDLFQLQDTESGAELMHMAECGLCEDGEQEDLIRSGATRIDGSMPINTDGGCLANGEPIGASGLRQVHENALQLRGQAGERQVAGTPRTAFSHVYGSPGLSACTVLSV